jgi:hypothetical protein
MNAVNRWKTIATIAIAFSAGNLFSTACQNAGGGKANAEDGATEDGDGSTPPPEVSADDLAELAEALVATEAVVAKLKCALDGYEETIDRSDLVSHYDVAEVNSACGI